MALALTKRILAASTLVAFVIPASSACLAEGSHSFYGAGILRRYEQTKESFQDHGKIVIIDRKRNRIFAVASGNYQYVLTFIEGSSTIDTKTYPWSGNLARIEKSAYRSLGCPRVTRIPGAEVAILAHGYYHVHYKQGRCRITIVTDKRHRIVFQDVLRLGVDHVSVDNVIIHSKMKSP